MAERLGIEDKLGSTQQYLFFMASSNASRSSDPYCSHLSSYYWMNPLAHLDDNNAERAMHLMLEEAMHLMLEEARLRNAAIVFADLERIDFYPYTRLFHL